MPPSHPTRLLYILHGFLGFRLQLLPLATRLSRARLTPPAKLITYPYPSTRHRVAAHGAALAAHVASAVEGAGAGAAGGGARAGRPARVDFVTHSFGGVVLRAAMADESMPEEARRGRACLLGPPLQGAAVARWFARSPVAPLARTVMGSETGAELSQEPFKGYNGGGAFPPSCRVLVVAGDLGPVNPMLDESSDGVVGVSETALETPHRRHHVKVWHNMLLFDAKVAETVVDFLNEDDEAELEEGQRMVRSEIQDEVGER
mmetsp:Transcript_3084/g.8018  ORF Transcript_3084/g.8018 Transcript_3084/m.8018 type:complete len:261 (+) Transcript_3084:105-887(+)